MIKFDGRRLLEIWRFQDGRWRWSEGKAIIPRPRMAYMVSKAFVVDCSCVVRQLFGLMG